MKLNIIISQSFIIVLCYIKKHSSIHNYQMDQGDVVGALGRCL